MDSPASFAPTRTPDARFVRLEFEPWEMVSPDTVTHRDRRTISNVSFPIKTTSSGLPVSPRMTTRLPMSWVGPAHRQASVSWYVPAAITTSWLADLL